MTQAQIDTAITAAINADSLTALKEFAEANRLVTAGATEPGLVAKSLA